MNHEILNKIQNLFPISCVFNKNGLFDKSEKKANYQNILSILTAEYKQTVHTQIRMLLNDQSDKGLYCFSYYLQILTRSLRCYTNLLYLKITTVLILGIPLFKILRYSLFCLVFLRN